jgi:predicted ATPase
MIHLCSLARKTEWRTDAFPLSVPAIAGLKKLEFCSPVTFFVGENGSGKSTLLEAIACGANAITVGREEVSLDDSLPHARVLADALRFAWKKKTARGFFLRAEDFFNFARRINQTKYELNDIVAGYEKELEANPGDEGTRRAIGYIRGQSGALTARYGENLDANSHGESFMKLFESRLVPNGLYLLDEPEAALSPLRQLTLLALMKQFVVRNCQFLIATHSPILMAFPDAQILNFDDPPIHEVEYDDLEHVRLMRAFLQDPQAFVRRL